VALHRNKWFDLRISESSSSSFNRRPLQAYVTVSWFIVCNLTSWSSAFLLQSTCVLCLQRKLFSMVSLHHQKLRSSASLSPYREPRGSASLSHLKACSRICSPESTTEGLDVCTDDHCKEDHSAQVSCRNFKVDAMSVFSWSGFSVLEYQVEKYSTTMSAPFPLCTVTSPQPRSRNLSLTKKNVQEKCSSLHVWEASCCRPIRQDTTAAIIAFWIRTEETPDKRAVQKLTCYGKKQTGPLGLQQAVRVYIWDCCDQFQNCALAFGPSGIREMKRCLGSRTFRREWATLYAAA